MLTRWRGASRFAVPAILLFVLIVFGAGAADAAPVGAITEFTAGLNVGSSARSINAGPDGDLWFSDMGTTKAIGRISTSGTIAEFNAGLNAGSGPSDTTTGADGNVWFADRGTTGAVGRITPTGTITEFSTGLNARSSPRGVAVGADGNMWFGDDGTTKAIGRITPSGTITEFSTGLNAGSSPAGVTTGPDGNVWFSDQGTTKAIGQITPSGTITEFSVGLNAGSKPADMQTGADGNLWFTDQGTTRAIGRITPSGTITEFSTGLNAGSLPNGMTPGPDGNIWFADRGTTTAIGRITPSGTITEFSAGLNPGSSPRGVAVGADGNVWFSDPGTTRAIGRIGTGAPAALVTPPTVTGGAQGIPQTCQAATWSTWADQQPSLSEFGFDGYKWLLDGSPIAGATTQTYTPAVADIGHQLSCTVTVTYALQETTTSATSPVVTVQDLTPPVTTAAVSPPSPNGNNGWYVTAPTVTLSAMDSASGVASTSYTIDGGTTQTYGGPFIVSTDGVHVVSFWSTDNAGNVETANSITVKVDLTNPTSAAAISPAQQNGWYASPTVTLTGADGAGSGIASIQYRIDGEAGWHVYSGPLTGFPTGNHFVQFFATDNAGRVESTVNLVAFKADSIKPTVTVTAPADGTSYPLGKAVTAKFRCVDNQSGIASCIGTVANGADLDTSTIGTHAFTVTATDVAGNVTAVTSHYTVHYTFNGFFSPVGNESDQALNLVHAGDLIKLGFGLNGDQGLGVLSSVTSVPVACPSSWMPQLVPAGGAGTTAGLSYGIASGHYTYGWQTDSAWAGTCREFQLTLDDGTQAYTAVFLFFA